MKEQICRYNKFGYCKYGDKCHFRHINEKCVTKDCNISDCEKRHPKICIFIRRFGRCKFTTYCSYDHEKPKENDEKISELEKKVENLEKFIEKIEPSDKNLAKIVDNKVEALEVLITMLRKTLEEKDEQVSALVKKFDYLENKFNDEQAVKNKEFVKKMKNLENMIKKNTKSTVEQLNCSECEFTTTSKQGLKTHIKRKHTKLNSEKYPKKCDLCEMELDDHKEMNLHLKTHSYRELKFKCEDCSFWGPNSLTMEVHTGKCHSEKLECGLCDYKAKSMECLETHISTCEIYECDNCYLRVTKISDIKAHMDEIHESENVKIIHGKQDRTNEQEIDSKEHWRFSLFPKTK